MGKILVFGERHIYYASASELEKIVKEIYPREELPDVLLDLESFFLDPENEWRGILENGRREMEYILPRLSHLCTSVFLPKARPEVKYWLVEGDRISIWRYWDSLPEARKVPLDEFPTIKAMNKLISLYHLFLFRAERWAHKHIQKELKAIDELLMLMTVEEKANKDLEVSEIFDAEEITPEKMIQIITQIKEKTRERFRKRHELIKNLKRLMKRDTPLSRLTSCMWRLYTSYIFPFLSKYREREYARIADRYAKKGECVVIVGEMHAKPIAEKLRKKGHDVECITYKDLELLL